MTFALCSILPAMWIEDPLVCGPVVFCTTRHLEGYPIKPAADARGITRVARRIRDVYGKPLDCLGLVLVPTECVADAAREGIPRMCRDAVAFCHITAGMMMNCQHKNRTAVCNWDYFEALPVRFKDGRLLIDTPALRAVVRFADYRPTLPTHLGRSSGTRFVLDKYLLSAFDSASRAVVRGDQLRELRQLFRAVALATQATRLFRETYPAHFDLMPQATAWTAAFETLLCDMNKRGGVRDVCAYIGKIEWRAPSPRPAEACGSSPVDLNEKRFPLTKDKKQERESAPAAYYRRLNQLRNNLAHGNDLAPSSFAAASGADEAWRIDEVAPLLFRECVLQRFRDLCIIKSARGEDMDSSALEIYINELLGTWGYHESLAEAIVIGDSGAGPAPLD